MIEVPRPDFVERAETHLEEITDGELLLLKGHLLLEEALFSAVRAKCPNPAYFEKADLGFYKLLLIARALYPAPTDDEKYMKTFEMFWDGAEALNNLRNKFAHSLEPEKIAPLLKRLWLPSTDNAKPLEDEKVVMALGITVSILIGYAWGLATKNESKAA